MKDDEKKIQQTKKITEMYDISFEDAAYMLKTFSYKETCKILEESQISVPIEQYQKVVEELQAYKIADKYRITVDEAAERLDISTYEEVCKDLDETEAEEDDEQEDLTQTDLLEENAYLKALVKKLEVSDVQKMKQSLESKISELEKQLEAKNSETKFEEDIEDEEETYKYKYNDLQKTSDKIKNLKISELDAKIRSDKKYQQLIMSLILHNSSASKLFLKHLDLDNTIRDIIIDARAQISDLQKQKEELENTPIQVRNNKDKNTNEYSYFLTHPEFNMSQYFKTLKNKIDIFYEKEAQNIDMRKITDGNFIIVNDDRLIDAMDLEAFGIPKCRIAVDSGWKSTDDWFGYYNNEGIFTPSKTMISDYYKFVKDTMELPFGVVVFDNFNQIPPETYIEPFIKNLETNEYYQITNPALIKDNGELAVIEKLHNLKYIMIKSQNDTAFEIPNSMKKYELGV